MYNDKSYFYPFKHENEIHFGENIIRAILLRRKLLDGILPSVPGFDSINYLNSTFVSSKFLIIQNNRSFSVFTNYSA